MTMPLIPRILATTALCLAAMGLSSCSWCWPSLHTSEAVLHQDKQVVVSITSRPSVKYRYQGNDYYPITLAYAVDKGKSIYRRGDGRPWCAQDNTERFEVQMDTAQRYLYMPSDSTKPLVLIPEGRFNMAAATRMETEEYEWYPPNNCYDRPYAEVACAVEGMPLTVTTEQPSLWKQVVVVPLGVIDLTASITMTAAEAAGIVVALPFVAIKNAFEGKLENKLN